MELNKKEKLYIAESIRILVTIIILYCLKIPLVYKIALIMVADLLDRDIPNIFFDNWIEGSSNTYQRTDKITDTLSYGILLFYILSNGLLSNIWNGVLILLYIFRTFGVSLFFKNNNRNYLFYFPNFFLEFALGLFAIKEFKWLRKHKYSFLISIFFFKIFCEYIHHFNLRC